MNISNQFRTRRSLFKKCKHFRINFKRSLLKKCEHLNSESIPHAIFFYAGNAHVMKADSKTASC